MLLNGPFANGAWPVCGPLERSVTVREAVQCVVAAAYQETTHLQHLIWDDAGVAVTDGNDVQAEANAADGEAPVDQKVCFIACPIGGAGSPERKRSDLIKTYVIDEVLKPLGYETRRSDEIDRSGEITTQIVSELIDADLVIADLTGHNANVFYELGVRHAFKLPYIQLIEDGEEIPFDIKAYRTIFMNHQDLESVAKAKAILKRMVIEIDKGGEVQSPVTTAVSRQDLQQSGDPEERELALIAAAIDRMDARLRRIEKTTPRPAVTTTNFDDALAESMLALYNQAGSSGDSSLQDVLAQWILKAAKTDKALDDFVKRVTETD